jgi:hypothetical protein
MENMETIVGSQRNKEELARVELTNLPIEEAIRCLRTAAPDHGGDYNRTESLAGNMLNTSRTTMPETRKEALDMQRKIRSVLEACPTNIREDIFTVREQLKIWATGMKAPDHLDDGSRVSLKAKFKSHMCYGPNNGKEIDSYVEIGERLMEWGLARETPHLEYQQLIGSRKTMRYTRSPQRSDKYARRTEPRRSEERDRKRRAGRSTDRSTERRRDRSDSRTARTKRDRSAGRGKRERSPTRSYDTSPPRHRSREETYRPTHSKYTEPPKDRLRPTKCYCCGKTHGEPCGLRTHPDANNDPNTSWLDSKIGKAINRAYPEKTSADFYLRWDSDKQALVPLEKAIQDELKKKVPPKAKDQRR